MHYIPPSIWRQSMGHKQVSIYQCDFETLRNRQVDLPPKYEIRKASGQPLPSEVRSVGPDDVSNYYVRYGLQKLPNTYLVNQRLLDI